MAHRVIRIFLASAFATFLVGRAVPALAQNGTLTGRVVDADRRTTDRDGKPIAGKPKDQTDPMLGLPEAMVTLELKGESPRKFQTITDAYGEWYKSGLPPGTYDISVRKEWRDPVPGRATKLVVFTATAQGVVLKPKEKVRVPDMGALTEEAWAAGRRAPVAANVSSAEASAANKRNAELEAILKEATALAKAGNHAGAIAQFQAYAKKAEDDGKTCPACYVKIGEIELKRNDAAAAETAFLKAIELDPKMPDPYSQLAAIYNSQRKFDEASKMTAKAGELLGATGGGDATTFYNQGVIFWNAGNVAEAKTAFAQAVKLDPKNANAQYWLGMTTFNLASTGKGALIDAKAPFLEYLKLAPDGEYVEVVKALLATIK